LKDQTPNLYDGKAGSPNLGWVRTVAQAAMALQLHGILENTGMPSASARLQHASLPVFEPSSRVGWDEIDVTSTDMSVTPNGAVPNAREVLSFEDGVVNDEGFDLLPLPVPAPERRILTVGNAANTTSTEASGEERFHYGSSTLENRYPFQIENDHRSAFLGEIAIDDNIDKLREVIGSVENTFQRCLISSGEIGKANRERLGLHLNVIQGLDSWEGMRGRFIGQRSLMKGVAGVEQCKELYEESDLALIDGTFRFIYFCSLTNESILCFVFVFSDLSWQTALASSAVAAAEDVRAAVRVARTAANARAAASCASLTAQTACERDDFMNLDEARAAQTRASIAQSHAIHAAVVEHEAKTVKRRATLALANDVETWNIHRKKEMLRSCIAFARSQHEATRRGVDAWSTLRDGFIGAPMNPTFVERKCTVQPYTSISVALATASTAPQPTIEADEVSTTIYDCAFHLHHFEASPTIVAVDHNQLSTNDCPDNIPVPAIQENELISEISNPTGKGTYDDLLQLPIAEAAPIMQCSDLMSFDYDDNKKATGIRTSNVGSSIIEQQQHELSVTDETIGESIQSIVNSIINDWGFGLESDSDDHLALPIGMAASILLENDHRHTSLSNPNGVSFNIT
jgi:hypothetical protein